MAVEIDLVLAALDSSDESSDAAEYASAIADKYDADLHLLFVLDHRIRQGIETGDITAKVIANRHRSQSETVRDQLPKSVGLSQSSVVGFSPDRLDQTPGSVTLEAAEELGADFLVLPRVPESGSPDEVLGKAALYVLEYASQPVLSV